MQDKTRSLRALDFLNFFNAGIQTGLGPFIAIFYQMARHWNPGQIGTLLAVQSLAGILVQAYIGDRVDQSKHKRMIAAVAAMVVTLGCLGIALLPSFYSADWRAGHNRRCNYCVSGGDRFICAGVGRKERSLETDWPE